MNFNLVRIYFKFDEIGNFASLQVSLNGIVHLDEGVRVAEGVKIMNHHMRDSFCSHKDLSHSAQFVLGVLRCNLMNSKVTLSFIDQSEIIFNLINAHDVHKRSRLSYIGSNFAINLNKQLHVHLLYFISCQCILKPVPL